MRSFLTLPAALALSTFGGVEAFWRMNCAVIQTGRIDPLVNYGALAAHAHTIVGGSNIGVNSTFNSLVNSECSSCEIAADKSAYWTPILYYSYPNGSFLEVPHGGSVVYYLARGPNAEQVVPYPKGFQILSGDKAARSYDNVTKTWGNAQYPGRPIADRVSFVCLPDGPPLPEYPYMFNTTCPNGMRAQIAFQSCWNGRELYKADNSHVAYLSGIDNGICPPEHPIQLPTLFLETLWAVSQVPNQTPEGRFVFSQGDPTGYGFHGDFQNGWEATVIAAATRDCLVPDLAGQIQYCPPLLASQSNGYPYNCPERPPQVGEPVHGMLDKLPGCITITDGPEAAPAGSMNCPANSPLPRVTSTEDSVPRPTARPVVGQNFGLVQQRYLGCFNDSAGSIRTLNAVSTSNYSVMTVEWCQNWCMDRGYRLSGVEYGQECHCDNNLNPTALSGSRECSWNCGGTMYSGIGKQQICGGYGHISVYNNTNTSFVAFGSNENTAGSAQPYTDPASFADNYQGCYSDGSTTGRTLNKANTNMRNLTIEACAEFCAQGFGHQYYGVEFSTQCYCGNEIANGGRLLTPTSTPNNGTCQMRCGGSEPQICGGANALSLYKNADFVAPMIKTPIGKYAAKGCVSYSGNNGRPLQGASMQNNAMTEDLCVKFCLGRRFRYAGIEYGSECYCGNSIASGTGSQQGSCSLSNLMFCPGNNKQYCGGPNLLTLYYSATL